MFVNFASHHKTHISVLIRDDHLAAHWTQHVWSVSLSDLLTNVALVSLVLRQLVLALLDHVLLIFSLISCNLLSDSLLFFCHRVFLFILQVHLHLQHIFHLLSLLFTSGFKVGCNLWRKLWIKTHLFLVSLAKFLLVFIHCLEFSTKVLQNSILFGAAIVSLVCWSVKQFRDVVFATQRVLITCRTNLLEQFSLAILLSQFLEVLTTLNLILSFFLVSYS